METYTNDWAANYQRLADAGIPGREGLYRLCRAFLRTLPADARILVVGCGTGDDLVPLARSMPAATFVGIDPAGPMLGLCWERVRAEGLSNRVTLRSVDLENYADIGGFDAATAILVSHHIEDAAAAARFFARIASLIKPDGRFYCADMHSAAPEEWESMLSLWREQALMSGMEAEMVATMGARLASDVRTRDEATIREFMRSAGFVNVLKPFSSLMYGAWAARRAALRHA